MKPSALALCAVLVCAAASAGEALSELKPNTWTELQLQVKPLSCGGKPGAVSWNKLVYDSAGRRIINIDRWVDPRHATGVFIYANSLTALDPEAGTLEQLSIFNWKKAATPKGGYRTEPLPENKGTPTPCPRHPYGNVAFVPGKNAIYFSAGANKTLEKVGGKTCHPNDTWLFDLRTKKWAQLPGKQPPGSLSDSMTYVPEVKAIVRWVSKTRSAWRLDIETHEWSEIPSKDAPKLGLRTAMTYDTRRRQVLLFGGQNPESKKFNDPGRQLWALSVAGFTWQRLPDGPAATGAGWVYAPKHDLVLCHRKTDPKSWKTGEFWTYSPGGKKWRKLVFEGFVPAKLYHTIAYDESRDLFVCQTRPLKWYVMRLDPSKLKK